MCSFLRPYPHLQVSRQARFSFTHSSLNSLLAVCCRPPCPQHGAADTWMMCRWRCSTHHIGTRSGAIQPNSYIEASRCASGHRTHKLRVIVNTALCSCDPRQTARTSSEPPVDPHSSDATETSRAPRLHTPDSHTGSSASCFAVALRAALLCGRLGAQGERYLVKFTATCVRGAHDARLCLQRLQRACVQPDRRRAVHIALWYVSHLIAYYFSLRGSEKRRQLTRPHCSTRETSI